MCNSIDQIAIKLLICSHFNHVSYILVDFFFLIIMSIYMQFKVTDVLTGRNWILAKWLTTFVDNGTLYYTGNHKVDFI